MQGSKMILTTCVDDDSEKISLVDDENINDLIEATYVLEKWCSGNSRCYLIDLSDIKDTMNQQSLVHLIFYSKIRTKNLEHFNQSSKTSENSSRIIRIHISNIHHNLVKIECVFRDASATHSFERTF